MSSHTPRQIAPMESQQAHGSPSVATTEVSLPRSQRPRKHVSTACTSCRAAKKRCFGGVPCNLCTLKGIECTMSETEDRRRGRASRLKELSTRADTLSTIFESIKSSDVKSLQHLFDLARADRPIEELAELAGQILNERELRSESHTWLRQAVLSIAHLVDDPPVRVPASPWTTVTSDDDAISHLVSIYFTWHHCAYPSIDQALFIQDMKSRDLSSRFCSSLLVNSILAVACMYTDHPCAFLDPQDPSTRGLHFMEEAARLLKLEEGKVSLTILQAFPQLSSSAVFLGKDRAGAPYAYQSIDLAAELAKHVKKSIRQGKVEYESPDFQRSYRFALRAAFILQTEIAIAFMRPLALRPPPVPSASEEELLTEAEWGAYPTAAQAVNFFPFIIAQERYALFTIAADLLPLVLSGSPEDSPLDGQVALDATTKLDRLGEIELKLLEWYQHLPPEAKADITTGAPAVGPLLDMHLAYYGFCITTQSVFLRTLPGTDPHRILAKEKVIQASRSIADIFECLQHVLVEGYFGVYYGHASAVSALNLVEFLTEPVVPSLFHKMIAVHCTVANRWVISRGIIKALWITLQDRKLDAYLEPATLSLFRICAVENWGPQDHRLFELCAYPNYAAISEKGRDFVEIGELLHQYAALQLGKDEAGGA